MALNKTKARCSREAAKAVHGSEDARRNERNLRARAKRNGYRLFNGNKPRDHDSAYEDLGNHGGFRLTTKDGALVLGRSFDATLEHIEMFFDLLRFEHWHLARMFVDRCLLFLPVSE